jgi:hypothetical protein
MQQDAKPDRRVYEKPSLRKAGTALQRVTATTKVTGPP